MKSKIQVRYSICNTTCILHRLVSKRYKAFLQLHENNNNIDNDNDDGDDDRIIEYRQKIEADTSQC